MPSRSYRLKGNEGVAAGLRRIALGRAEKALDALRDGGQQELGAAIHGARKDLKKLRAVLRISRDGLGKTTFKAENRRYREAGRLLSGSRDAEVKLETLRALRSHPANDLPAAASQNWEELLERERDAVLTSDGGEAQGRIEAAVRMIGEGRDRIDEWPLQGDSWKLVSAGLADSYRQGRRALKRTRADAGAAAVHEWRKRAKDLWYQLRIVQGAWPQLLGETANQAHELADLLGDHHDLALLADDLEARQGLGDREPFAVAIAQRQEELLSRALEIGARLYAEQPKAFAKRLRRYWCAWRGA